MIVEIFNKWCENKKCKTLKVDTIQNIFYKIIENMRRVLGYKDGGAKTRILQEITV